jgi:hypothetical protein
MIATIWPGPPWIACAKFHTPLYTTVANAALSFILVYTNSDIEAIIIVEYGMWGHG